MPGAARPPFGITKGQALDQPGVEVSPPSLPYGRSMRRVSSVRQSGMAKPFCCVFVSSTCSCARPSQSPHVPAVNSIRKVAINLSPELRVLFTGG
jgi:hypothetical protein